jgi:hypothetical protein
MIGYFYRKGNNMGEVTEENIIEAYQNMSLNQRKIIYNKNRHKFPDMSFTEWNKHLPKSKSKDVLEFYKK